MKHKKSISQTYIRRNNVAIPRLFRRAKDIAEYPTNTKRLFEIVANLPTEQYYIADDAAFAYIRRRILQGVRTEFMNPYKQKLFDSLYEEVSRMMEEEKYRQMGLKNTIVCALTRPAPCIGLTPFVIFRYYRRYLKSIGQKLEVVWSG